MLKLVSSSISLSEGTLPIAIYKGSNSFFVTVIFLISLSWLGYSPSANQAPRSVSLNWPLIPGGWPSPSTKS